MTSAAGASAPIPTRAPPMSTMIVASGGSTAAACNSLFFDGPEASFAPRSPDFTEPFVKQACADSPVSPNFGNDGSRSARRRHYLLMLAGTALPPPLGACDQRDPAMPCRISIHSATP